MRLVSPERAEGLEEARVRSTQRARVPTQGTGPSVALSPAAMSPGRACLLLEPVSTGASGSHDVCPPSLRGYCEDQMRSQR